MSNDTSTEAQRSKILNYLKETNGLSTLDARESLGIMAPAARVLELKDQGYPIITRKVIEHDVTGTPHKVAKYYLLIGEAANSYKRDKQTYHLKRRAAPASDQTERGLT